MAELVEALFSRSEYAEKVQAFDKLRAAEGANDFR
jgi:hypothetical protein